MFKQGLSTFSHLDHTFELWTSRNNFSVTIFMFKPGYPHLVMFITPLNFAYPEVIFRLRFSCSNQNYPHLVIFITPLNFAYPEVIFRLRFSCSNQNYPHLVIFITPLNFAYPEVIFRLRFSCANQNYPHSVIFIIPLNFAYPEVIFRLRFSCANQNYPHLVMFIRALNFEHLVFLYFPDIVTFVYRGQFKEIHFFGAEDGYFIITSIKDSIECMLVGNLLHPNWYNLFLFLYLCHDMGNFVRHLRFYSNVDRNQFQPSKQ